MFNLLYFPTVFYLFLHYILIVLGFNDTSTLVGHLCRLPEIVRKEIEEIVELMKEGDREERGAEINVKKQKK